MTSAGGGDATGLDTGLGGKPSAGLGMIGNVFGSIASTKGFTDDETNNAVCPSLKRVSACVLALVESHKTDVRSDDELELTVVSGAVTSVTSTSGFPNGYDQGAHKCATDAIKSATFPSRSGVVRYRVEVHMHSPKAVKGPKMIAVAPKIPKGLPPEVIKRILRANFPRFRACYEQGLRSNEGLAGVVAASFTIDKDGAVASATLDEKASTMPDPAVKACVLRAYRTLSFPKPEGVSSMTVVYPIEFKSE